MYKIKFKKPSLSNVEFDNTEHKQESISNVESRTTNTDKKILKKKTLNKENNKHIQKKKIVFETLNFITSNTYKNFK